MVGPLYRILYILSSPINYKLFVLNLESLSFRRINGFFLNLSSVLEAGGGGVLNSLIREGSPAPKGPTPYPFIWPFLTEV